MRWRAGVGGGHKKRRIPLAESGVESF